MLVINKQLENDKFKTLILVDNNEISDEDILNLKKDVIDLSDARIVMDRPVALCDSTFFEKLCQAFPGIDVFIKVDDVEYDSNFYSSQVFDKNQMEILLKNNEVIKKYGANLYLSGFTYGDDPLERENIIPFSKVVQANIKMNEWVDKINNAKVDGKPLSPFEKYLYAYQFVTQFKYKEGQIFEARDISRVLSGKFIVCAGYSSILSELCRRIGIVCKRQFVHSDEIGNESSNKNVANHECCVLNLVDPKYNIDGFFLADPTLDSYDYAVEEGTTLTHSLIPLDEFSKITNGKEQIIVNEFSSASNYYFLRDCKILPDIKTFSEEGLVPGKVEMALKDNYFDEGFIKFMHNSFELLKDDEMHTQLSIAPKYFDSIYLIDKAYNSVEISNNLEVFSNLALKTFSSVDINDANSFELKRFFFESLDNYLIYNKFQNTDEVSNELSEKLLSTAKTSNKVYEDSSLLYSLANYNDSNLIFNSNCQEKFTEIINTHNDKIPKIKDYLDALVNVYIACGGERDNSIKYADFMVNASTWLADALGWAKMNVNNAFAKEAEIVKPIERFMKQKYDEISRELDAKEFSNNEEKSMEENLKKLGVNLENNDEITQFERIKLCSKNFNIKFDQDVGISLE